MSDHPRIWTHFTGMPHIPSKRANKTIQEAIYFQTAIFSQMPLKNVANQVSVTLYRRAVPVSAIPKQFNKQTRYPIKNVELLTHAGSISVATVKEIS